MSAVHQVPLPPVRPQDGAKAGASVCVWLTLEPNPPRREQWAQYPGCPTPVTPAPQGEALQVIQDSLGGSECSHGCSWRELACAALPAGTHAPLCSLAGSHISAGYHARLGGQGSAPQIPWEASQHSWCMLCPCPSPPSKKLQLQQTSKPPGSRWAARSRPNHLRPARRDLKPGSRKGQHPRPSLLSEQPQSLSGVWGDMSCQRTLRNRDPTSLKVPLPRKGHLAAAPAPQGPLGPRRLHLLTFGPGGVGAGAVG